MVVFFFMCYDTQKKTDAVLLKKKRRSRYSYALR